MPTPSRGIRRVLLCTNSRDRGSTSRTLEAWARLLPNYGIHPTVSVGGDGPLLDALRRARVDVHELPIRVFFDRARPLPFVKTVAALAARMRRSHVQLVHVNEHEHYPVVARAARLARLPVVVHLRFRPDPPMCRWLFKPPYTSQRLFFTSRTQMADSASAVAPVVPENRWRLLHDGLDLGCFGYECEARERLRAEWGVDASTTAIGTASSISSRKRLDHFVRLVAMLWQRGLNVRGFIAGRPYFSEDDDELRSLKELVVAEGVADRVTFLGYVEPAEALYQAWDVCVSTSSYETFGMTVLEAMACRCPVVAYPGGSVAEVIGENGIIVEDGNLGALGDAVAALIGDEPRRKRLAQLARSRAEQFDLRHSVDQLVSEYEDVLATARSETRRGPSALKPNAAMRVLLCTNSRDRGSTSRTLEAWTRLLVAHDVDPSVSVGGEGPLLDALRADGVDVHEQPIRVFFDARRPLPFLTRMLSLAALMRRKRIAVVHVNEHEHYPVVARAARLARVPAMVHLRFRPDAAMCRWLFREPYTPRRLFFTSQTQMDDSAEAVEQYVPRDRWRLVYNGLDLESFGVERGARERLRAEWKLRAGTVAIGTASSISARKRLDHFVHLIADLVQGGFDVHGFIAGRPYFEADELELQLLKTLVATLGLTDRVSFLGYVEPAEPLYHAWDVCVSTSEYETFGMTMLEAMACRCPVVAYPGGSVVEVVGDGGIIVEDGNRGALRDAVVALIRDETRRREMGRAARRRAEQFDLRRSIDALASEYRAVAAAT